MGIRDDLVGLNMTLPRPSSFARKLSIAGLSALFVGGIIFILNYERQTINLLEKSTGLTIIEYHAPGWDPFPHTAKITVDAHSPVMIVATLTGATEKTDTFLLQTGEERITVYPEETLVIRVNNPHSTTDTIKTVLWCDSWNYTAWAWVGFGALLLLGSLRARHALQED